MSANPNPILPPDFERSRLSAHKETNDILKSIRVALFIIVACSAVTACNSCDTVRIIKQAKIY